MCCCIVRGVTTDAWAGYKQKLLLLLLLLLTSVCCRTVCGSIIISMGRLKEVWREAAAAAAAAVDISVLPHWLWFGIC
jgi:hypothetical protein